MSNYLETNYVDSGKILYSPTSPFATPSINGGRRLQPDSIEYREVQTLQSKDAALKGVDTSKRVSLPAPEQTGSQNELDLLAAMFVKAFAAMHAALITQTNDYAQMQQLSETQTQSVLESTTNNINKEEAALKEAQQIEAYQNQMNEISGILNWVLVGLTAALMIVTFASGFIDGFASEAALAPEAELVGDAASGAAAASSTAANAADASTVVAEAGEDAGETASTTSEGTLKTIGRFVVKVVRSSKFKIGMRISLGMIMSSPMLMNSIVDIQLFFQKKQLADAQRSVGEGIEVMQKNNMYSQFLQQLVQREGSVFQDEASSANTVVETFSSIADAYRQITFGLSQAV